MRGRRRRRELPPGELMLAAMVDMMINLLIFLLTLYGTDPIDVRGSQALQLARSDSHETVAYAVQIVVSQEAVEVQGKPVLVLTTADGHLSLPKGDLQGFADALLKEHDKAQARANQEGKDGIPDVSIQVDKRVPWTVLGPVLTAVGEAGYGRFRFVVRGNE